MSLESLQKNAFEPSGSMWLWDLRHRLMHKEIRRLADEMGRDDFSIIDFAAGGGEILRKTKEHYPKSYAFGVDLTESSVSTLRSFQIEGQATNLENPFPVDRKFDIALAGEIIEHLINTDIFLQSLNNSLRHEGYLILSFPNINQPLSGIMQLFLDLPPFAAARYNGFHVRDYTLRIMKALLAAHGFDLMRRYGTQMTKAPEWTHALCRPFPRFGKCIVLVLKKVAPPNDEMLVDRSNLDVLGLIRELKSQAERIRSN